MTLVTGLFICLRSAAKITHKAQSVTSLAAKWHACATISSFDELGEETPTSYNTISDQVPFPFISMSSNSDSDTEEGDGDDEIDNTKLVPIQAHTISYHKRQALGKLLFQVSTSIFLTFAIILPFYYHQQAITVINRVLQ